MSTDLALPSEQKPTVSQMIQQLRPEIQRALPAGLSGDRMARLALTCVRMDEKLAKCDPMSFAGALLSAAALGLEPGVNGEAYIMPYGREATLVVGYQGYAKLFWQSPLARHLDAQPVFAADDFDYGYGTDPFLRHKPARGERGEVIAYYAVAGLANGANPYVVLTPDEVKRLRGGKEGPSGRIPDPMRWMERKTALRQLFKITPKSTALATAIQSDERDGSELYQEQVAARELQTLAAPALGPGTPEDDYAAAVAAQDAGADQ